VPSPGAAKGGHRARAGRPARRRDRRARRRPRTPAATPVLRIGGGLEHGVQGGDPAEFPDRLQRPHRIGVIAMGDGIVEKRPRIDAMHRACRDPEPLERRALRLQQRLHRTRQVRARDPAIATPARPDRRQRLRETEQPADARAILRFDRSTPATKAAPGSSSSSNFSLARNPASPPPAGRRCSLHPLVEAAEVEQRPMGAVAPCLRLPQRWAASSACWLTTRSIMEALCSRIIRLRTHRATRAPTPSRAQQISGRTPREGFLCGSITGTVQDPHLVAQVTLVRPAWVASR